MIIPTKHTSFSESFLGFGAYILSQLESPRSLDELWSKYKEDYKKNKYFAKHSFDHLILTVLFLFSIEAVSEKDGVISKCS